MPATTRPRVYADLNPCYPAKGEYRWTIFHASNGCLTRIGRSYRSKRSAERDACILMVEMSLQAIGFS